MIATLILWFYIFILTYSLGFGAIVIFQRLNIFSINNISKTPLDYVILVGFVVLTTILGYLSLFINIGAYANISLLILSSVILIINYKRVIENIKEALVAFRSNFSIWTWGFSFTLFAILIFSIIEIKEYDTALYHTQSIQWIENYKAILGLGNVHTRIAFNSHFFLSCALFDSGFIAKLLAPGSMFYPVNSFFFFIFSIRAIIVISKAIKKNTVFDIVLYGCILFFSFHMFALSIQSPTPDIIVAILFFYITILYLNAESKVNLNILIIVLLIGTLVTFKLSAAMSIVLLFFVVRSLSKKEWLASILIGLVIIGCYVIRNIVLSGYFIYPMSMSSLDFLNVDWKIPISKAISDVSWIKSWARIPGKRPGEVLNLSFSDWVPQWWKFHNSVIILISFLLPFSMVIYHYTIQKIGKKMWVMSIVCTVNLIFWFAMAPDPRFGYGFLIISASLVIAIPFEQIKNSTVKYIVITLVFISLYSVTYERIVDYVPVLITNYDIPMQSKTIETTDTLINGIKIYKPKGDEARCFTAPLPCTPYPVKTIQLRGKSIKEGFRTQIPD